MQFTILDRDVEALANRIQRGWRTGPVGARQRDSVDESILRYGWPPQPFEFGVQESAVEFGIVRDDRIITEERHQLVDDFRVREPLLVAQEIIGQSGDADRRFAQGAFGIDVDLKFPAGLDVVVEFYTSDFDDAFSVARLESCGFGVECDFPHVPSASADSPPCPRTALRISST